MWMLCVFLTIALSQSSMHMDFRFNEEKYAKWKVVDVGGNVGPAHFLIFLLLGYCNKSKMFETH